MADEPKDPEAGLSGLLKRLDDPTLYTLTVADELLFNAQYLRWLCHGEFNHIIEEDWERMLRQKRETPATKCRHGKNPLHCNVCYFEVR
jgi:hypothetical protein